VAAVAASFLLLGLAPVQAVTVAAPNVVWADSRASVSDSVSSLGESTSMLGCDLSNAGGRYFAVRLGSCDLASGVHQLILRPVAGADFVAGTTRTTSGTGSLTGSAVWSNPTITSCGGAFTSTFTVLEATRVGDVLQSLAADYSITCAKNSLQAQPTFWQTGSVRFNSAVPYAVGGVSASYVSPSPTPVDQPRDIALPLGIKGDGSVTVTHVDVMAPSLTSTTVDPTQCVGVVTAADPCTITVHVGAQPASSASTAAVAVVVTTLDGPAIRMRRTIVLRPVLTPPTAHAYPTTSGISVAVAPDSDADVISVLRRPVAGGPWSAVGNVSSTSTGAGDFPHVDDSSAERGVAYEYAVKRTTSDLLFSSAVSEPMAITRPAVDPVPTSRTRIAHRIRSDAADVAAVVDDTDAGLTTDVQHNQWSTTAVSLATPTPGGGAALQIPLLPGPGSYTDAQLSGVYVGSGGLGCSAGAGSTALVRSVLYSPDGTLLALDASMVLVCGAPVDAEVRFRTGAGMAIPVVTPGSPTYLADPDAAGPDVALTVTNTGPDTLDLGSTTLAGSGAARWTASDCSAASIAAAASCTITTAYDGAALPETSTAVLSVGASVDGAARPLSVPLTGRTSDAASAPENPYARIEPQRLVVDWAPPVDSGGRPVIAYAVERSVDAGTTWVTLRDDLVPTTGRNRYVDESLPQGDLRYRVRAVTDRGPGSSGLGTPTADLTPELDQGPAVMIGTAEERATDAPWGMYLNGPWWTDLPIPLEVDGHEHESGGGTPDGRSVVYSRAFTAGAGEFDYDLYRLSLTPGAPNPVRLTDTVGLEVDAETSPDMTRIAYTHLAIGSGPAVVQICTIPYTGSVGGAAPVCLAGFSHPSWLSPTVVVAADVRTGTIQDRLVTIPMTASGFGAPVSLTAPIPAPDPMAQGSDPTVSPDGGRIAFVDGQGRPSLYYRSGDYVGGPWITGTSPTVEFFTPTWVTDSVTMWARDDGGSPIGAIDQGGSGYSGAEINGIRPHDSVAPVVGAVTPGYLKPGGTVHIAVTDVGSPKGGVALACRVDSGAEKPCTTGLITTGLPAGHHTVRVVATDVSGNVSAPKDAAFSIDGTAPTAPVLVLPSYTLGSSASLRFTAKDASPLVYDIQTRTWPMGQTAPNGWSAATAGVAATSRTLSVPKGTRICVRVRARDAAANVGTWSAESCVSPPLDDRYFFAIDPGWRRITATGYLYGTATQAQRRPTRLASATGVGTSRLAVVATVCPTCGSFTIYRADVFMGSVNLASRTTTRRVFVLPTSSYRYGQIEIRTTSSRLVRIDAVIPIR
jgi:hypothetical protein